MQTPKGAADLLGGRYRLKEAVGRGGMGAVHRGRDEHLGRDVAVKLFRLAGAADLDRQHAEVKILAGFVHHSLVTLFDAGIAPSRFGHPQLFLVMELVEGEDLQSRLQGEPVTTRHIAQIGVDVAEALEYIHRKGVVHRDVKPANILLTTYNDDATTQRARLTDFGIAKIAGSADITDEGALMGTAAYLSPEQARGDEVAGSSDIYSLGLVLLECFTGKMAFPGSAVPAAIARLIRDPQIPADLPREWVELLTAMTARATDDRPTARAVIRALGRIIHSEQAGARDAHPSSLVRTDLRA